MILTASNALRFLDQDDIQSAIPINPTCVLDKYQSTKQYIAYMLDRTNSMFEYSGLPDTIPAHLLELYLQIFGYAAFINISPSDFQSSPTLPEIRDKPGLHIFFGGIGGARDIYYRPKLFVAANPRLKKSFNSTILYPGDDIDVSSPCVLMRSDENYMGLLPLFNRYAAQLTENDISIRSAQINARALMGISVNNDAEAETARKYIDDLEAGKLGIMGKTNFLNGISVANVSTTSSNHIIQLIELQQYLKASWYNELGLNVNFNMKREYMSEEEIAVNTDILLPLVDDMLKCRQRACELINSVFGTNISVRKSSAWANKEQEELSALSEAAMSGQIPLKDTITDKIEGDTSGQEDFVTEEQEGSVRSEEQTAVQSGGVQSTEQQPDGADAGAEGVPGESGSVAESPAEVTVNVNINVEGGDSDEQPEAYEKSEKSSAGSGDSEVE